MKALEVLMLMIFVGVCLGTGAVGGAFTKSSVKVWFPRLTKPAWNPPSWVFAPVWTILYALMAIAGWLIWRGGKFWGIAGGLFCVQLVLNFAWSWFFFALKRPGLAFAEIVVLWTSILATMVVFWQTNPTSGWLFVPYLLWVSFASVLNHAIWRLNPNVDQPQS